MTSFARYPPGCSSTCSFALLFALSRSPSHCLTGATTLNTYSMLQTLWCMFHSIFINALCANCLSYNQLAAFPLESVSIFPRPCRRHTKKADTATTVAGRVLSQMAHTPIPNIVKRSTLNEQKQRQPKFHFA